MSLNRVLACPKFSLSLVFLLFLQQVFGQLAIPALDAELERNKKFFGNDFVVMIWKDTLVYKKEIGSFNAKTPAPIASASKWLTAALVMSFVDEGKISLDDKVSKYLPVFAKYGKSYITIRHCLSHMTGIQADQGGLKKLVERKKFASLEEEVNAFASSKEIQANPGTEFRYSNIGLNIAGRILEVVSKRRFDMLIRQRIFVPLGMRNSSFSTLDGGAINPSGGAKSTANDYMNFLVMVLNNGKFNGKQVLSEESMNEMRAMQTKTEWIKYAPKSAEGFNYALGSWVIEEGKTGQANVLSSPGLFGTWPMVDYCRGYAYIFFVKSFLGEQRADAQLELKKLVDEKTGPGCN